MDHKPIYVSSMIKRIRQRLNVSSNEIAQKNAFKAEIKDIVGIGIADFARRLQDGQVAIDNVTDFDKMVKLGLLLHGEPTERIDGTKNAEVEQIEETFMAVKGSDEFEAMKLMLAERLNARNEEEEQ